MITRLAHACLFTNNLRSIERFYCEALGLEKAFDFTKGGDPFGFYLKLGEGTFLEVFRGDPAAPGGIHHLAIEVEDIDGVIKTLRSHGYDATDKKLGCDKTWQAWSEDPSGTRLEFQQYTDQSLQRRGGSCEVDW